MTMTMNDDDDGDNDGDDVDGNMSDDLPARGWQRAPRPARIHSASAREDILALHLRHQSTCLHLPEAI